MVKRIADRQEKIDTEVQQFILKHLGLSLDLFQQSFNVGYSDEENQKLYYDLQLQIPTMKRNLRIKKNNTTNDMYKIQPRDLTVEDTIEIFQF